MSRPMTWGDFVGSVHLALRDTLNTEQIANLELNNITIKRVPISSLKDETPEIDITVACNGLTILVTLGEKA